MVEAEVPPAVPDEWSLDLTHVTPVSPKVPSAASATQPKAVTQPQIHGCGRANLVCRGSR